MLTAVVRSTLQIGGGGPAGGALFNTYAARLSFFFVVYLAVYQSCRIQQTLPLKLLSVPPQHVDSYLLCFMSLAVLPFLYVHVRTSSAN